MQKATNRRQRETVCTKQGRDSYARGKLWEDSFPAEDELPLGPSKQKRVPEGFDKPKTARYSLRPAPKSIN